MIYDYRQFMSRSYSGAAPCFDLVRDVYRECYGVELAPVDLPQQTLREQCAVLHSQCLMLADRVSDPKEGDVVLIRSGSRPWHIGLVISPPLMLHVMAGHSVAVEDYTDIRWRNAVEGFYRHKIMLPEVIN